MSVIAPDPSNHMKHLSSKNIKLAEVAMFEICGVVKVSRAPDRDCWGCMGSDSSKTCLRLPVCSYLGRIGLSTGVPPQVIRLDAVRQVETGVIYVPARTDETVTQNV